MPSRGVFAERGRQCRRLDAPAGRGVEDDEVGRLADGQAPPLADDLGRPDRERRHQRADVERSRLDGGQAERESRLEADESGRGIIERHELALWRVWGVVGGDGVDRAVHHAGQQCQGVAGRRERRVDAAMAVVRTIGNGRAVLGSLPGEASRTRDPGIGHGQVMRRDVAGHRQPASPGSPNRLQGRRRSRGA